MIVRNVYNEGHYVGGVVRMARGLLGNGVEAMAGGRFALDPET